VADAGLVRQASLTGPMHAAEGQIAFTRPTSADAGKAAMATKTLTVTFRFGSAELDENGKTVIEIGFADVARQFGGSRVRLVGHTDSVGSDDANMALSRRRAQSVRDYLIRRYRFDSDRFITVGKGETQPVASNDTEAGRSKNRRVDFEILN
jgi:outer membrane protein OmpA-like peptidoglycan-associated protein